MEYTIFLGLGFILGWATSYISSKQGAKLYESAIVTVTRPIEEEVINPEEENVDGLYDFQAYEDYSKYIENFGLPGQEEINTDPDEEEFEELK